MEQTAVEWLVDEMIQRKFFEKETELSYTTLEHLTNQAKEMENQQQDEFAIGFAEWCLRIRFEPIENPSVKKLLEIYKKENEKI